MLKKTMSQKKPNKIIVLLKVLTFQVELAKMAQMDTQSNWFTMTFKIGNQQNNKYKYNKQIK